MLTKELLKLADPKIKLKRGSTTAWNAETADTKLSYGQLGLEYVSKENGGTVRLKAGLGDGTDWKNLNYIDPNILDTPVDSALSTTSANPVQNKVVTAGLNKKTERSVSSITLTTAGWSVDSPYTQVVTIEGITSTMTPFISTVFSSDSSTAINEKISWNYVSKAETGSGNITFTCFENKPTVALTLQVVNIN